MDYCHAVGNGGKPQPITDIRSRRWLPAIETRCVRAHPLNMGIGRDIRGGMVSRIRQVVWRAGAVPLIVVIGVLSVLATGGGGGSGGADSRTSALTGIWVGSESTDVWVCLILCWKDSVQSGPAMALARGDGELHVLPWNLTNSSGPSELRSWHIAGNASISGSQLSGTLRRQCDPLDGPPIFGHVVIDGSVASRTAMDLEYTEEECVGSGAYNLDFDTDTDTGASAEDVAGIWSNLGSVINIGMDGEYDGATGSGCVLAGRITPVSAEVNLYNISTSVENCASLDGRYSGLAAVVQGQFGMETLVLTGRNSDGAISLALTQ